MSKKFIFNNLEELSNAYYKGEISGKQLIIWTKSRNNIKEEIESKTSFLDNHNRPVTIEERCWYIANQISEPEICPICKKNLKTFQEGRGIKGGYRPTCTDKDCKSQVISERMNGYKHGEIREERFSKWQDSITEETILNDDVILEHFYEGRELFAISFESLITNPILIDWLMKRYDDTYCPMETVKRIKLGIEKKPVCEHCGKPVPMDYTRNTMDRMFKRFCCKKCSNQNELTCQRKQESDRAKNGGKLGWNLNANDPEKKRKIAEGWCRNKNIQHGTSIPEKEIYNFLKEIYPSLRFQYTSEDYPHRCDFYLPYKDLYIEYQGSHFHHGRPFDPTNEDDIKELNILKDNNEKKLLERPNKSNHFQSIIKQWTVLDPSRRQEVAKKGLNWLEIWPDDTSVGIIEKIESYPNIQDCSNDTSIYRPLSFKPTVEDLF